MNEKRIKELDLYNPFIEEKIYYTVLIRFKCGVDMCEIKNC